MKATQSSLPSRHPLQGRTGKHFTCPLGFRTTDGTGASSTSALPEAGAGAPAPVSAEQLHHLTRFGVIWAVSIQPQKFGKHFVNNPRPGRLMLSQSGSSERVTFPSPAARDARYR